VRAVRWLVRVLRRRQGVTQHLPEIAVASAMACEGAAQATEETEHAEPLKPGGEAAHGEAVRR